MDKIQKPRKNLLYQLAGVILLIGIGMFLIAQGFVRYGQLFLDNQDEQIYYIARSVDRNIASMLEQLEENLRYVVGRRGFVEAQENWRTTGNTEDLLFRLEENLLIQNQMISTMLVVWENEIVLSTDGDMTYELPEKTVSDTLVPCKTSDGKVTLAFVHAVEDRLKYVALLDLDHFYEHIVSEDLTTYDWVLLTDISGQIVLQPQDGHVTEGDVDAISGATYGTEGMDLLLKQQAAQTIKAHSYEYVDGPTGQTYTARILVIPTNEADNGTFAIGVVTNFDDVLNALNDVAFRMTCYGGMVAVGVLLLVIIAMRYRSRSERDLRELAVLREKNEAMEELNKKTQELAHHQRLETIGTLTSSIAHEFNNLLTPIMGYSILTLEKLPPEDEELYDNVLEIYQASRRASDIISRLSALSRKNTGMSYQRISMDDLIAKVLHVAMPARPVAVDVKEILNCGNAKILGNETQLSQMILNLVLNGFHAMEVDGGILSVTANVEENIVVLTVEDTGCGIPKDVLPNIFEPFYTTKETGKGTGLGLAIVRQVVSEHQGTIQVDSTEHKGTVFTVRLPLTPKEEKLIQPEHK